MADDAKPIVNGQPGNDIARKIKESRDKLLRIFDGILDPIYIIDRRHRLISVNNVQAERYGTSPRKLVDETCHRAFYGRPDPCPWCPIERTMNTGEPALVETKLRCPEGSERLFEMYTFPITDDSNRVGQIILYLRDVTDRRRLERLATLGEAAAAIIHEIKTPLTVVQTAAQILSRSEPDPERKKLGDTVVEETRRMGAIVHEILEFARGESSYKFEIKPLGPVIKQVVDDLKPPFANKGVHLYFEVSEELEARIDVDRVHQVYLNLGVNALEALQPGGNLSISLSRQEDRACIRFDDDGPGIPENIIGNIFEPFVTGGKSQGTGLGLAIVRRIILGHGGQIMADNRPGGGASFKVYLPLSRR